MFPNLTEEKECPFIPFMNEERFYKSTGKHPIFQWTYNPLSLSILIRIVLLPVFPNLWLKSYCCKLTISNDWCYV